MTVMERYATAVNATDMTVSQYRRTGADVMIASGWTPERMGALLRRLQAEWESTPKRPRMTNGEYIALALRLRTLPKALRAVSRWCEAKRIDKPRHVASEALYWWLDPLCHACGGKGRHVIKDTPALGMECVVCGGRGSKRQPENSARVLNMMDSCVGGDVFLMRKWLRQE